MKHVAIAAIALVLGLVLGGIGPRGELRALKDTVDQMEDGPCKSTVGSDLAALMGGGLPKGTQPELPARNALGDRPPEVIEAEHPEAAELVEEMREDRDGVASDVVEGLDSDNLALARTALELRRAQARAALIEDAQPDGVQLESIDTAVKEMNTTLRSLAGELSQMFADGNEPSRRDAMEFAADALDAMLIAEDSMRGALDADQISALEDGSLDPFSYVDPGLVDLLERLGETQD